jgi:hypothetical protein
MRILGFVEMRLELRYATKKDANARIADMMPSQFGFIFLANVRCAPTGAVELMLK